MLTVKGLSVSYDGIKALNDVSIGVAPGEIVTLIGANGAGKSTLLRAIVGLVPKAGGTIKLYEKDLQQLKTPEIIKQGISLVPETKDIFLSLTVKDNLKLGLFFNDNKAYHKDAYEGVFSLFPRLKEKEKQISGTLSGGQQQMLAIGRALMQKPKYLLLDEPSLGLSPKLTNELLEKISAINKEGTAILLVEQRAKLALKVASRGYVLGIGTIVRQGSSKELLQDELVKKIYFGA
ncbi:MAG: ABC transporter ATP-binding protein [Nitrospirae bacterium]|nr:ABC transporter ATP-binding protein [Nitrospirota bacterium]